MFTFKAFNERNCLDIHDLSEANFAWFNEYRKYSFMGDIIVEYIPHDEEDGEPIEGAEAKRVAILQCRFFDNTAIINDGMTLARVADMYDEDVAVGAIKVEKSGLLEVELDMDKEMRDLVDIYIEHLFVEPEFRGNGMATFILNNLRNLMKYHFNVETRCVFAVIQPQIPGEDGNCHCWKNVDDPAMKEVMVKTLTNCEFEQLEASDYYVRNYGIDGVDDCID